jgi:undecaprenyl diphosphate synthase
VFKISEQIIPKHIAIIPDGNRRWAKEKGISTKEGYARGIAHIESVLSWCRDAGIEIVTMWGFSAENFKREKGEVNELFFLFKKNLIEKLTSKENARVRFFGRIDKFPKDIIELFEKVEKKTKERGPYQLNLLLSYGGREEIIDAVNDIMKQGINEVDEKTISDHLYTAGFPDPDLVIRTSGEQRLSGLMPWQTTYSEFYFSKKLWPDFSREDFQDALEDYSTRKRKFGR